MSIERDIPFIEPNNNDPNGSHTSLQSDHEEDVFLEDPVQPAQSTKRSLLKEVYAVWDVNTHDVLNRLRTALLPIPKNRLISSDNERQATGQILNGTPDMWGPVWIYFSLVLALFMALSMPLLLDSHAPAVDLTELSSFAALLSVFIFVVPFLEWLLAQYLDLMPKLTLLQTLCLAGYTFAVYIPAVLISASPLCDKRVVGSLFALIIRCLSIGTALLVSTCSYLVNLSEVASRDAAKSKILMFLGLIAVLHSGFAVVSLTKAILVST